jgi:hypothetical protein
MTFSGLEEQRCREYAEAAAPELPFESWYAAERALPAVIVAEGFEDRSLGVLSKLAAIRAHVPRVVIGRYVKNTQLNAAFRKRFERLAEKIAPGAWSIVENQDDGRWVAEAAALIDTDSFILDISGISNSAMFGALDAASATRHRVIIGYTDAVEYWPRKRDWERLQRRVPGGEALTREADKMPWLQGYQHSVRLVPGHEGYDSVGSSRALLAFLPFKSARLASVLSVEDYSAFVFLAVKPRFEDNAWRLDALKQINESIIRDWPVLEISAFNYRGTVQALADVLFGERALLENYDLHFAVMGSKLQTLGCWIVSTFVKSIAIVTSSPAHYYPKAFSSGIGESWFVALTRPASVGNLLRVTDGR